MISDRLRDYSFQSLYALGPLLAVHKWEGSLYKTKESRRLSSMGVCVWACGTSLSTSARSWPLERRQEGRPREASCTELTNPVAWKGSHKQSSKQPSCGQKLCFASVFRYRLEDPWQFDVARWLTLDMGKVPKCSYRNPSISKL